MSRNTQPNILSIEAIIKKSELSKAYNDIPTNLKRLFLDQLVSKDLQQKNQERFSQIKKTTSLFTTKNSVHALPAQLKNNKKDRNFIPPLPPKKQRAYSLNSSKKITNQNQLQHKPQSSRSINAKKNINSGKSRYSLCEVAYNKIKSDKYQNKNTHEDGSIQSKQQKQLQHVEHIVQSHKINKRLSRYEFEIPLAEKQKSKIKQSLSGKLLQGHLVSANQNYNKDSKYIGASSSKNILSKRRKKITIMTEEEQQIKFSEISQQKQLLQQNDSQLSRTFQNLQNIQTQSNLQDNQGQSNNELFYINSRQQQRKRKQTQQKIPDYLLTALSRQTKYKKSVKNIRNFEIQLSKNEIDKQQYCNNRITKQPCEITKMKRRMSYNKMKKTEQSQLQPQANLIVLLHKKQKQKYMSSKSKTCHVQEQNAIKRKSSSKAEPRIKKHRVQDNVCGWEIHDTPMFFDNY